MDIYKMIEFGVEIGLLTIEIARELRGYFQKNGRRSKSQTNEQRVITEALIVLKEIDTSKIQEEPFTNIGWLRQFITVAHDISDISIQKICGRILAQEFVSPGVTPQRMGQILLGITYEDMQKFQIISSMNIGIITNYNDASVHSPNSYKKVMVPFEDSDEYSEKIGIYLEDIHELQAMGLLTYNSIGCYLSGFSCKHPLIYANGKTYYILWHPEDKIPIGNILLTKAGECLSNVINECKIIDEYAEYVRSCMEYYGVTFAEQTMYSVGKTENRFILTTSKKQQPYFQ